MKTFENKYKLTVCATPIGNLDEVNYRLIKAFNNVEIVLCEDTRVTKQLFNNLNINNHPQFIKFEKYNENQISDEILNYIFDHKYVILVSDAGYPLISDPGYPLIKKCIQNNISIEVINGPSAILHSLILSSFPINNFMFLGFIGNTRNERIKKLNQIKNINTVFILYESVHRIKECLIDIKNIFQNTEICINRELTKIHEESILINTNDLNLENLTLKGEFTIVINNINNSNNYENDNYIDELHELINHKLKSKEISKYIANKYNVNQNDVYKKIIEFKKNKL